MKKRYYSWFCVLCTVLLVFSGCSEERKSSTPEEIPSTLTITAELPTEYPGTVAKYQVEWCNVNEQAAIDAFMRREPTQREEWAQGPTLRAEADGVEETLVLLQTVTPGGLIYHWKTAESERIRSLCDTLRKQRPYELSLIHI